MSSTELLNAIAALEKPDGIIAFPTDTVYGLGCKIDHPEAIDKIYRIKGRSENKPLVLLGVREDALAPFIDCMPESAASLMVDHWPGPLTIVLPKTDAVPDAVTKGFPTVALRIPDCTLLLELLALVPDGVLATTSANVSGEPPFLTAGEVRRGFGDTLDFILDEDTAVKEAVASTVVAVEPDGIVRVLRTGSVVIET